MNPDDIEKIIKDGLGDCKVEMQAEGNKLMLLIVSHAFEGLNRVKRQQVVYGILNDLIASGEIHAVSMRTLTPGEASDHSA
ncbi:MAG: BolA/IbaG family iron-sulfur metabolism protein [Pseudomonadales bacterium]